MKSLMICLAACGCLALLPSVSSARDRSAEAASVASSLGLESGSYRVLSANEADQVRGTGGLLNLGHILPNVSATAVVHANVNVLHAVKVNANVFANVRIH